MARANNKLLCSDSCLHLTSVSGSKAFKRESDLTRHLRNSKDERCLIVAQEEFGYIPHPPLAVEVDEAPPDSAWPGDFFGSRDQYDDADFPMSIDDVITTNAHYFGAQHLAQAGPSHFTGAMSSSDEDEEIEPLVPELEEIEEPEESESEEDDDEDEDSDIEEVDPADVARLVDQIAAAPLSPSRIPSPSPSHSSHSSTDGSYAPSSTSSSSSTPSDDISEEFGRVLDDDELHQLHEQLSSKPVVERFPAHLGNPGAPVSRDHRHAYEKTRDALNGDARDNVYAPLSCQMEWDFARWAKLRGPSSTALTELLKIDGVRSFFDIITGLFAYAHCSSVTAWAYNHSRQRRN